MAGYVIAQVNVKDPDAYAEYRQQVAPTVEAHGGRFLARGGAMEPFEGDPPGARVVIIEFPSVEDAKAWYNSEQYRPLIKLRQKASEGILLVVEGA